MFMIWRLQGHVTTSPYNMSDFRPSYFVLDETSLKCIGFGYEWISLAAITCSSTTGSLWSRAMLCFIDFTIANRRLVNLSKSARNLSLRNNMSDHHSTREDWALWSCVRSMYIPQPYFLGLPAGWLKNSADIRLSRISAWSEIFGWYSADSRKNRLKYG